MTDMLPFKIQSIEVKLVMLCFYYELVFGKISWKVFFNSCNPELSRVGRTVFHHIHYQNCQKWNKIGMK